jgi:hypothetical protein
VYSPGWVALSCFCFARRRGLVSVRVSPSQLGIRGCYVSRCCPTHSPLLSPPSFLNNDMPYVLCKRCIKTPSSALEMLASCAATLFRVGTATKQLFLKHYCHWPAVVILGSVIFDELARVLQRSTVL